MDVEMTDASPIRSSDTVTADRDLVKTVRSLDQTGPGLAGENLDRVWKQLTSTGKSQFSAAEESALRWLLKTMKATNDEAETVRRFPLTWRILGCAFQRIPLFSLAKSLADRKFIAVLQQTLKGIAKPELETKNSEDSASKKRKRTSNTNFDLQYLKTSEGCMWTGDAVFGALTVLLARLDPAAQWSAHDRMGAEHIKALFAQPATDVVEYLAPLLSLCDSSLSTSDAETFEAQETWIEVFSATWDLHLQGSADALEVATHFSQPSFSILGKLKEAAVFENQVAKLWKRDLEKFLQRNLILPARSAYLNQSDLEIITRAFSMVQNIASTSVPILYGLISSAPQVVGGLTTTKANEAWMQEVFKLSERANRQLSTLEASRVMGAILEEAIANKSRIALEDLRAVCGTYALTGNSSETDWRLLALIAECDTDVFQQADEGFGLFDQVCDRITAAGAEADEETVNKLIVSLITGFENVRDLSTFLKKWFGQMSKIEDKALRSGNRPVWFTGVHRNPTLISGIEKSLTTKQLTSLLQWVEKEGNLRPAAVLIFLNTIATAITKDDFSDAVGTRLSDLVLKVWSAGKIPSDIRSLRWRIISKTVSWLDYEASIKLWDSIRADLSKALQKAKFEDEDTCEALECAYHFWLSMHPDGRDQTDLASLLAIFVERLLKKVKVDDVEGLLESMNSMSDPSNVPKFCVEYPLAASRFVSLLSRTSSPLPDYLERILGGKSDSELRMASALDTIFSNENNLRDRKLTAGVVDYAIDAVAQVSGNYFPWTEKRSRCAMIELSRVPDEAFTRQQRERIMEILIPKLEAAKSLSPSDWTLVLGLLGKIMRRPTFYQNMAFADLQKIAALLKPACKDHDSTVALGLSQLLDYLSTETIRQISDNQEYRTHYFDKVSNVVKEVASDGSFVQMTLLKALLTVVKPEAGVKEKTSSLFDVDEPTSALGLMVQDALSDFGKAWRKQKVDKSLVNRVLIALDAAEALPDTVFAQMKVKVSQLEEASQQAITSGYLSGWKLRSFLLKRFPSQLADSRPKSFKSLFTTVMSAPLASGLAPDPLADFNRQSVLEDCVDAVIAGMDHNGKVAYVQSLLEGVQGDYIAETSVSTEGQLLAIRRVIAQMTGKLRSDKSIAQELMQSTEAPVGLEKSKTFDLATAHGKLIRHLAQTKSVREFVRTAEILQQLLDVKSNSMTQWNIETTLSAAAVIVATDPANLLDASPSAYQWLCKLIEVIIKKHRLRLEGHYHILVATLEALLGVLARQQIPASIRAKHAAQFTRLVTLVCEPAAAAVSRVQHLSALDSATDAAKRSAGRHMYLVLMAYVKMQLDVDVPRDVREALEPGMNSIFDISPPEVRKILNDSMDASGRAILREMYRSYTKFGKWSGV